MTACTIQQPALPSAESEAREAIRVLRRFISPDQLGTICESMQGEEQQFFFDKVVELAGIIDAMPVTFQTEGQQDNAIAHLHYFVGGCDWFLTERDVLPDQHQAFGLADMGCPELGYISIVELLANGVELDMYWTPKPLREIAGEAR